MKQHRRSRRGEKSRSRVYAHQRQMRKRDAARVTGTAAGRGGDSITPPGFIPANIVEGLEAANAKIAELQEQLRLERVRGAVDLRVAGGLVREADREAAVEEMMDTARWPDAAIVMIREDYVKMINRLVRRRSGEPQPPASGSRGERYVC